MLITIDECMNFVTKPITGIIHIGAHECEEQLAYDNIGISQDKVIWIEAMKDKVATYKAQGFNIYQLAVFDIDDKIVNFNITNNGQSSSLLELGTHLQHHPHVHVVNTELVKTTRMDTFIEQNNIDIHQYNFLNLDIQGIELRALKSFGKYIDFVDYIYTEVNTEEVYKKCDLLTDIDSFLREHNFVRVMIKLTEYNWGDALYKRS